MKSILLSAVLLLGSVAWSFGVDSPAPLSQREFERQMKGVLAENAEPGRARRANELIGRYWLSSLQVKAIAATLADDDARLEFATAAYRRTVDPENFYEVYDAFSRFSKVFRLHDRIREFARPYPLPTRLVPPLDDRDLKSMVQALKQEPFEQSRLQLARQIFSTSRGNFLSAQVRQLLGCFDFEPTKLEVAKFAYKFTLDPEMYFVVQEAFTFKATRDELTRYIQQQGPPPRRLSGEAAAPLGEDGYHNNRPREH